MIELVQQHLARARHRMQTQAKKRRSERSFVVGDWIYLKLQPYVQASLAPRANQKLAFQFFGPYKILAHVGSVAYKLELPSTSTIHLVFHVSQLKRIVPSDVMLAQLPNSLTGIQIPEAILQRRLGVDGRLHSGGRRMKIYGGPKTHMTNQAKDRKNQCCIEFKIYINT